MMKRKTWIMIIAGAVAAAGALTWAFSPRAVLVETARIERGVFEQTVDEDGKTRVRERYVVSAPLAGRVRRISLKAGDAVDPGTVIATLDPAAPPLLDARTERELMERVGAAEASLAKARTSVVQAGAALAQSNADLRRTQKLAQEGFLSAANLERDLLKAELDARAVEAAAFERHAAEHQVELARAALTRSRRALEGHRGIEQLEIRSPVRGRVLRVAQESEAVVSIGAPLVELADPGDLEVVVDVLTSDAVHIAPGAPVRMDVGNAAEQPLEGRVRRVEPSAYTKVSALGVEEQRVNVIIDIVSPRERWRSVGDGYRVDARIVVHREENALRVPVSALFRDNAGWAVFVVDDRIARTRAVNVVRRGTLLALIDKGVAEGERVIIYPGEAVRDGAKVSVSNR
jgi:HlyD family secretion protein